MKINIFRLIALVLLAALSIQAAAETLAQYVSACKIGLGLSSAATLPALNCNDGVLFAVVNGSRVNDYVGYKRINENVEATFACRWMSLQDPDSGKYFGARSIEMLIHNRQNGNTCFFSGSPGVINTPWGASMPIGVLTAMVSPTDPAADSYWAQPETIENFVFPDVGNTPNSRLRCVGCHVAGPYIASPRIAPFLARYGLLNNGHDTFGVYRDTQGKLTGRYHALGATFSGWDALVANANTSNPILTPQGCSNGCHSIGYGSDTSSINEHFSLIPSLQDDIAAVNMAGVMPANNPINGSEENDYRWINRDNPFASGDVSDSETLVEARKDYPTLLSYCGAPTNIEAHAVGSDIVFMPRLLPDKLVVFNLRDGLVCLNSDQENGQQCQDYKVRYQCTDTKGNKTWTDWYNMDSPSGDGDHEERSKDANLCTSPTGLTVTAIQAGTTLSNGWTYTAYGPNDRLAQFNAYGLVCNNADQPDGKCSNYVVRFTNCTTAPDPKGYTAHLTSVWTGKRLTATGTATQNDADVKAQPVNTGWTSQNWVVEPVVDTGYVRLKNAWNGRYLNGRAQSDKSTVATYDLNANWLSEQWIIESISGSNDFRIKNVWSGKYLNVVDVSNYSSVLSQTLNTSWASERWLIQ